MPVRIIFLTVLAMTAFAGNSLLCRLALGAGLIDAASFTMLRVSSGALMLGLIFIFRGRPLGTSTATWRSGAMLFVYMAFFSFAYLSLGAGMGALILFGAVQLTMFAYALKEGERYPPLSWFGLCLALGGLVYLVMPGLSAPDLQGALLMAVAGIAWGIYSLLGRGATDPLEATARNFVYSIPLCLLVSLIFWSDLHITGQGLILAIASGALASGCGYVIWYAILPHLGAARAATVQLCVPALAAFGGVILLSEDLGLRLILASIATLGGVALVLSNRAKKSPAI